MALIKKEKKGNKVEVQFQLPVNAFQNPTSVKVVGDFNAWNVNEGLVMKQKDDVFVAKLDLSKGQQYQFKYVADDLFWENDYNADLYVFNEFSGTDNSVVDLINGTAITAEAVATAAAPKAKKATKKAPAKKATAAKATAAKKAPAAKKVGQKTDLALIDGVGPKLKKLFKEAGIQTIQDLSSATIKNIEAVIETAGPRFKSTDANELKNLAKNF